MSSHRYSRFYFIPAVRELARMVYRKGARAPLSHGFSFSYFFVICTKKHHYFISVDVLISIKKKSQCGTNGFFRMILGLQ